jgi:hypothetical protein
MHSLISVADPGYLSRIRIFLSRIPDPNVFHPRSRIRIKEFKYFNPKKWFTSSRKYDPGCSSRIWILIFYPSRIPGVKKAQIPDLGSGSATLPLIQNQSLLFCSHVPRISALLDPGIDTHFQTLIALAGGLSGFGSFRFCSCLG